jgi:hypothetical protein
VSEAGELLYLDASALVKLVQKEPESDALAAELAGWPKRISSAVADVEVRRAAFRAGHSRARADLVLAGLTLLEVDEPVRALASRVGPPTLRALDAIHLASALTLGERLGAICSYDRRLTEDAERAGLTVLAPVESAS